MADEVTWSGDLRAASVLNRAVYELLHDPTDLRQTCLYVPGPLSGAMTVKVPQVQPSYGMSAPGEVTTVANTALVDASYTMTPARRALRFEPSDLFQLSAPDGGVDAAKLVELVVRNVGICATDLICTAGATASTNVGGGGGVDASVDDLFDAIFQLQSTSTPGPYFAVFAPNSWNEIMNSLRSETGALQFLAATGDKLKAMGPGYKGELLGVNIFQSDSVVEDTSVNQNFAFGLGAIAFTEAAVGKITPMIDRRIAYEDSSVYVTAAWDDLLASWRIVGNYYAAFAVAEQNRLVGITTDDA